MSAYSNKEKVFENLCRRQAKRLGLQLVKSRARMINVDNLGEYMILDPYANTIVAGRRFELDLEDVKKWLDEYEQNIIKARG